jgi:AsmA protein
MKRTTPLLYTVTGLCALLVALVMFWLVLLPNRLSTAITAEIESRTGLQANTTGSSLNLGNGLSVELRNVTLAQSDAQSVPIVSVDHAVATLSLGSFFGSKMRIENLLLENPVINIKSESDTVDTTTYGEDVAAAPSEGKQPKALSIVFRNGTVKWSDSGRQVSVAVSDLNGTVKTETDGSVAVDIAGLFNGKLTHAVVGIDDMTRIKLDGSPGDVMLTSGKSSLSFSGRARTRNGLQMDGRLIASAENLRDVANWFGLQLSGFAKSGAVSAESAISWDGALLDVRDLALQLGQSKLKGKMSFDTKQARPLFSAALDAESIDLGVYAGHDREKTTTVAPTLSTPWTEKPMDFRDVMALDAHITINAEKLIVAGLQTGKASLALDVKDGAMAMTMSSADVAGGQAKAEVHVVQNSGTPDVALNLSAKDVNAKSFLEPLTGFAALDGPLTLNVDLTSKGDSTARIISSLGGTAQLSLADGKINGLKLVEFLAGKGRGWRLSSDKVTALTSGEARFDIQDGIAQIASMNMESSGLKLAAEGEVDLLRQSLDLICKPEIAGAIKLPVRVAVTGTWTDPAVDTDIDPTKLKPKALLKTGKKAIKKLFGN